MMVSIVGSHATSLLVNHSTQHRAKRRTQVQATRINVVGSAGVRKQEGGMANDVHTSHDVSHTCSCPSTS